MTATEPKIHDYTVRGWGHDYAITKVFEKGQQIKISGWGHGISEGDFILIQSQEPTSDRPGTRYRIKSIEYCRDPSDMWFASATFDPRP